ncbi:hypothetical protein Pmani_032758 [Petrolisthes manimaculis]|uniref:Uncharacterized protein n=1 Tax=Petrolisthes manimaculis TaxID=1843537 RepID=A0AAE1NRY7_9EUCA|nr:hypothetical protein Pmani_032758 [Petrolisthes manimaculis]
MGAAWRDEGGRGWGCGGGEREREGEGVACGGRLGSEVAPPPHFVLPCRGITAASSFITHDNDPACEAAAVVVVVVVRESRFCLQQHHHDSCCCC